MGRGELGGSGGRPGQLTAPPPVGDGFRPPLGEQLAPSGAKARITANLAAIRTAAAITAEGRPATPEEQRVLSRWSSWGAVPAIFDETRDEYASERTELRALLTEQEYTAARRTTVNAHYTDPTYVAAMWNALQALGFAGGRVLEPGCGSGTFIGLAPAAAEMTGVELDPVTARIAAALYPGANIRAESFAETRYPAGFFDAAIGNVPFAEVRLHDPRYNPGRHTLHNHFILKALELTRPGGIVAVLTSSFTMDGQNPAARREMHAAADLVGAVRLPSGAHRRTAGTEVVTDLLILRRRAPDEPPLSDDWVGTERIRLDDQVARVNSYFLAHPDRVLGHLAVGHGMHGEATLLVRTDDLAATGDRLTAALTAVVTEARDTGLVFTAPAVDLGPRAAAHVPDGRHWAGHIAAHPDGAFTVLTVDGGMDELAVPATQRDELRSLLSMRDLARDLLSREAASRDDTPELDRLRSPARGRLPRLLQTYGPINRSTITSSATRVDPDTGEPVTTRADPAGDADSSPRPVRAAGPGVGVLRRGHAGGDAGVGPVRAGGATPHPDPGRRHRRGRPGGVPGGARPGRPGRHRPAAGGDRGGGPRRAGHPGVPGPDRRSAGPRGGVPVRERPGQTRPRQAGRHRDPDLEVNVSALLAVSRRTWARTRSNRGSAPPGSAPRTTGSSWPTSSATST